MILFGHPTGNPNSHQAALAHYEAGRLAALCVPWMPTPGQLRWLGRMPGLGPAVRRLERRCFPPLLNAPRIEGRGGELWRMARRLGGRGGEDLSYEANDWLMQTMRAACRRPEVGVVHAYEDCAAGSFEEAKRLGKACLYDLPIGYYPAWEETQAFLARTFVDWLPPGGLPSSRFVRPQQKRREMELADCVLAPSTFVLRTVERFAEVPVELAPYGVDADLWKPGGEVGSGAAAGGGDGGGPLRFLYAGQASLRKGIPLLLGAWEKADLADARLDLVGAWELAPGKRRALPRGVVHHGPCSREELRGHYRRADWFVFPSYFEGFGLVLTEAMACGIPGLASDATAGPDVLDESCGRVFPHGDEEALVEVLREVYALGRQEAARMGGRARARAETLTWENYRACVCRAADRLMQADGGEPPERAVV